MVLPLPDQKLWRWMLPEAPAANRPHTAACKKVTPMDFARHFQSQLDALKAEGNYRIFADLERRCGAFPKRRTATADDVAGGHRLVLERLSRHGPAPRRGGTRWSTPCRPAAPARAARATSAATPIQHRALEAELADLHGKEAALLFTSGYVSNWAALSHARRRASRTR